MGWVFLALGCVLAGEKEAAPQRPFHEISREITELLTRESATKELSVREDALRRLCELHGEILRDPRIVYADPLKEYRIRIWARLKKVQQDLKTQLARDRKKNSPALSTPPDSLAAQDGAAETLALLDGALGGPGLLLARGGGAQPADYGPALVDLIERTINPDFWDTNGGTGHIHYFQPLHCLVITATSEIHGRIGGLADGLRAAGP